MPTDYDPIGASELADLAAPFYDPPGLALPDQGAFTVDEVNDDDAQLEVEPDEFSDRVPDNDNDHNIDDVDNIDHVDNDDNHNEGNSVLLADDNFDTEDANGGAEGDEAKQAHRQPTQNETSMTNMAATIVLQRKGNQVAQRNLHHGHRHRPRSAQYRSRRAEEERHSLQPLRTCPRRPDQRFKTAID